LLETESELLAALPTTAHPAVVAALRTLLLAAEVG
jgi:hypothetical protein